MGVLRPLHAAAAGSQSGHDAERAAGGAPSFAGAETSELRAREPGLSGHAGFDGASLGEDVTALRAAVQRDAPHLRLLDVIGEGGMSVVFAATHLTLDLPVAVKVLRAQGPLRGEMAARLLFEGKLCAVLSEAGAPRVLDARKLADGTPYVVMERIAGEVLADLLERGPLDPALALEIADGLLYTLSAVHAEGVVHRDVKPANIIVEPRGQGAFRVRLIDFGVATQRGVRAEPLGVGAPFATQTGTVVGTPDYMAPEQLMGRPVDGRADVYAAAATLFHMLTGAPPFHRGEMHLSIAATLRDPLPQLTLLRPGLPLALEQVLSSALMRDPDARTPSAEALRVGLRSVAMGVEPEDVGELPGAGTRGRALHPGLGMPGFAMPSGGMAGLPREPTRPRVNLAGLAREELPREPTRPRIQPQHVPAESGRVPTSAIETPVLRIPRSTPSGIAPKARRLRVSAEDDDTLDDLDILFPRRRGRTRRFLLAIGLVAGTGAAAWLQRTPVERLPPDVAAAVTRVRDTLHGLASALANTLPGRTGPHEAEAPASIAAEAPAQPLPAAPDTPAPSRAAELGAGEPGAVDGPGAQAPAAALPSGSAVHDTVPAPSLAPAASPTGARDDAPPAGAPDPLPAASPGPSAAAVPPLMASPDGSFASPALDPAERAPAPEAPARRAPTAARRAHRAVLAPPDRPLVGDGFPLAPVLDGIDARLDDARDAPAPTSSPATPLRDNPY